MISEFVITMQIRNIKCPKCESGLKGRKREDAKNKGSRATEKDLKWIKHIAWRVRAEPDDFHRGTRYYHFDCYIPQTKDGIEQKEYWTWLLTGQNSKIQKKKVLKM